LVMQLFASALFGTEGTEENKGRRPSTRAGWVSSAV
jgi:hypothetical protein